MQKNKYIITFRRKECFFVSEDLSVDATPPAAKKDDNQIEESCVAVDSKSTSEASISVIISSGVRNIDMKS